MLAKERSLDDRARRANLWLAECPPVQWLADKLGLQPLAVAAAGLLWLVLFVLWGFMGELVCKVVGNLYPMYASFRAIEDDDQHQVSSWLVYWVTFAALTLLEGVGAKLLSWLPFYYVMRLSLIVWLFLPATRGAEALYCWGVAPVLRRQRPRVDAALARSAQQLCGTFCSEKLVEVLRQPQSQAMPLKMEDLMAEELAKAAAARLLGSRARTASPRPSPVIRKSEAQPFDKDK
ncbi:unnamed protein product [Effrenium voratum]|nr:unnamed protein product [Effrenium voratum]|mmetsp:Transcript_80158/g.192279  ORF Transcript_80158/g.192279 Transcript_80158/m.192279 type:complete len:234 (-) Transcript_80158:140-841(-)|eukprot:CAMPEP_0181464116 /NCGR_PEP_ID=MMETSP1110-20121109/35263_1 /TAXON_ID=174948 /ORGANISM="Symbiodinium sp., Strain CCMP421" /LENGTH=233 /DNA_ID=CAMNT_0023588833 /DNA_START=40 /DNA_END=741 /DNA_ORIENTATION=-